MATATSTGPAPSSASADPQAEARVYRCVSGDTGPEHSVRNRVRPACQIALPGKNAA
jgi:hypothetical protein